MNLMIELTNRCDLRCPTCFSHQDGRPKGDMPPERFQAIIDRNCGLIGSLSLYNYGEPLLHEALPDLIAYAKARGIGFIKIATNGMSLMPRKTRALIAAGLDYLSISLDGATRKTYEQFRIGGDFNRVIAHVQSAVKLRDAMGSALKIEIQFIIMKHNAHEIGAIEELARHLGVDRLRLKTVLVKKEEWRHLLPEEARYSRYSAKTTTDRCNKPAGELVINCEGTVIPCCYIVGADIQRFAMGNAFDQPLEDILNSPRYRDFIRTCTTHKADLSCCADCNEGNLPLDYKVIEIARAK